MGEDTAVLAVSRHSLAFVTMDKVIFPSHKAFLGHTMIL